MPVKIKKPETFDEMRTSLSAILALVENFVNNTFRINPFAKSNAKAKMNTAKDAFSVWFSRAEIYQLFEDNKDEQGALPDGLRIYYGMHGNKPAEKSANARHPEYKGQYTTILVCTKNKNNIQTDLLDVGKSFTTDNSFEGMGDDEGHLKPPPYNNSGMAILPNHPVLNNY